MNGKANDMCKTAKNAFD